MAARVSASIFPILGGEPILGRTLTPEEDVPGHNVVLLGYGLWQRRFGGDKDIVGRAIELDRQIYTVVGVMPRDFAFPIRGSVSSIPDLSNMPAEIWLPMAFTRDEKSSYQAVIVSPEQAFRIMMELKDPHRTLVFMVAVTGLRISEALGLKRNDLDYERKMIHLRRVWVGNDVIDHLKTDGSAAPVPLGELLADALRG